MDDLALSTRKKRKGIDDSDDTLLTPKKARISHATPRIVRTVPSSPASSIRSYANSITATPARSRLSVVPSTPSTPSRNAGDLPPHLVRLLNIHTALEQSMSLALATGQMAPDPDTGRVPAVLNHLGLAERGMGRTRMSVDDLRRLCWVWEWDRDVEHEPPSNQKQKPPQRATRTRVDSDISMCSVKITKVEEDEDDNPFLNKPLPSNAKAQEDDIFFINAPGSEPPKDWVRGGSGFIITPATHVQKNATTGTSKRVPAYGIGIEVDWAQEDVAGGRVGGMGAVARWTAAGETRKRTFKEKLERWGEVHSLPASGLATPAPSATKSNIAGVTPLEADSSISVIPFANLPALPKSEKLSTCLVSSSPNKPSRTLSMPSAVPFPVKTAPSDKYDVSPVKKDTEGFMIPFPVATGSQPITPSGNHTPSTSLPRSGGIRTPSFGRAAAAKAAAEITPSSRGEKMASGSGRVTPIFSLKRPVDPIPKTPTHRRGNKDEPTSVSGANSKSAPKTSAAEPETPTSARRRALYERIRTKSESESPDKKLVAVTASVRKKSGTDAARVRSASVTKFVTLEELRRRCILGRLGSVAEAVWMFFASPTNGSLTSTGRKRRAIQQDEVVRAVVKSADSPVSDAEAVESLEMLCELCPFFLKRKVIDGEDWLEMPATTGAASMSPGAGLNPSPGGSTRPRYMDGLPGVMGSPGKVRASEEEFLARSPRRIKKEEGGLRQVREIIRRELEVDDDND